MLLTIYAHTYAQAHWCAPSEAFARDSTYLVGLTDLPKRLLDLKRQRERTRFSKSMSDGLPERKRARQDDVHTSPPVLHLPTASSMAEFVRHPDLWRPPPEHINSMFVYSEDMEEVCGAVHA
jgi:hypothetical protein